MINVYIHYLTSLSPYVSFVAELSLGKSVDAAMACDPGRLKSCRLEPYLKFQTPFPSALHVRDSE